jgi:lipopolysaccharide/colanic/teichoic acid biosynthesis glycosyltransferase
MAAPTGDCSGPVGAVGRAEGDWSGVLRESNERAIGKDADMLFLIFLGACTLIGLATAVLASGDGAGLLGVAVLVAAMGAILAGTSERVSNWIARPAAIACVVAGGLSLDGGGLLLYLGLGGLLLVVVDRFAALSQGLAAFCLPRGGAGAGVSKATPLTDPVAREFAHVRRDGSSLAVASISVQEPRGASRRLARIARDLLPHLRRTDVVVRVMKERLVLVLPGGDARVAAAVLRRSLAGKHPDLRLGIASFPDDGPNFAALREVAQAREQAWPDLGGPPTGEVPAAAVGERAEEIPERPPVLIEAWPGRPRLARAADLLVLALAAPLLLPLLMLLALIVKLDSPGPVFVRIRRVGRDGRTFELLKLRSMVRDAESRKEALRHLSVLPWPDFKLAEDPRVTRAGRWLRKYSLDELPQLYNVLRGEMTLVGPRPCSVRLADYEPWQGERLDVTPGLAGRWQAGARGTADFVARCRLDIRQAKMGSARVSLILFIATLRSVLRARGAL